MDEVKITLPWPPSVNRAWQYARGWVSSPAKVKAYHMHVKTLSMTFRVTTMLGRVSADIIAFPPDKRQRDLDNLLKISLDALQKSGFYKNDSQIDDIRIRRGEVTKGEGRLQVTLKEIPDIT